MFLCLFFKVFIKWAWYLVEFGRLRDGLGEDSLALCNALELICLLSPDDMEHKLLLARLFMHLKININEVSHFFQCRNSNFIFVTFIKMLQV